MSNLYRVQSSAAEIAAHFGINDQPHLDVPSETKSGEPGIVVRKSNGQPVTQSLIWGFATSKDATGQPLHPKPVNLVADLTNPMWDKMVVQPPYRCLIPLTAFAQPAGRRGLMTRTWFSVKDCPIVAWAGFCRNTAEWGPVYAGMTTDSNSAVAPLNPRMPVLLSPDEYDRWFDGSIEDVIDFQFRPPFPADRLTIDRTDEFWVPRKRRARQSAFL